MAAVTADTSNGDVLARLKGMFVMVALWNRADHYIFML